MDKWLTLHVRKKLINLTVRVLNRLMLSRDPQYPQTRLLGDVYAKLLHAYEIEAYCGRFDDVPFQTLEALRDRHFLNLLELSRKVLLYLGDTDRYYRQWLGLFMLLTHDAVEDHFKALTVEEAFRQINDQWDYGLSREMLQVFFPWHVREVQEAVLCNHLHNLVTLTPNRGDKNHEHSIDRP